MIFIYGNNVALYTLKGDLIGIIIRNNEQVASAMKMIFEMYWGLAKNNLFNLAIILLLFINSIERKVYKLHVLLGLYDSFRRTHGI